MAARKTRGVKSLPEEWKNKIRASLLIDRLVKHAMGEIEMTAQQVRSAEILLKKVAPDLSSVSAEIKTTFDVEDWAEGKAGDEPITEEDTQ